ncbi:hypothetical protein [Microbacterium oleivorans]|uniref:Uncharacterized protein n=1 Tax=Microbacterium oleivorans TaxID=273677 RepID=A0A7D5JZF3_9MICO|nr:hypothetical protein [Microbacterium oleivorans]QLD12283.1 hypothetical protein HW566_11165 [Microbacterium oleivorans]
MERDDDSPQLGHVTVDRRALDEPGMPLRELAASLGLTVDEDDAADAPGDGWRMLRRDGDVVMLGTPAASAGDWHLAQAGLSEPQPMLSVHGDPLRLRPSRAERRWGLELRWPPLMTADDRDATDFVVDIVNVGARRWVPDGDSFLVMGGIVTSDEQEFSFAYMDSGMPAAVPLDPGEYARTRVGLGGDVWRGLDPGSYRLRAVLVELGLHAEPLTITVTAEQIDRARASARRPARVRRDERRWLEQQIAECRAAIAAREVLPSVAEIVRSEPSSQGAVDRIAELLSCDLDAARGVYQLPLGMIGAGQPEERLASLMRRLAEL